MWSFQGECRFILKLLPISVIDQFGKKHLAEDLMQTLSFEQDYFDIELDQEMLDNIIVTLGPTSTESDRIIVHLLLKEYTKNGKILISSLTGNIKSN